MCVAENVQLLISGVRMLIAGKDLNQVTWNLAESNLEVVTRFGYAVNYEYKLRQLSQFVGSTNKAIALPRPSVP